MYDLTLLSGISGLSFDSLFLSPLLFFYLVLLLVLCGHFCASGSFSYQKKIQKETKMTAKILRTYFPEESLICFVKR